MDRKRKSEGDDIESIKEKNENKFLQFYPEQTMVMGPGKFSMTWKWRAIEGGGEEEGES